MTRTALFCMPNKSECKALFREVVLGCEAGAGIKNGGGETEMAVGRFDKAGYCSAAVVPLSESPDAVLIDGSVVLRCVASVLEKKTTVDSRYAAKTTVSAAEVGEMLLRPALEWAWNGHARDVVMIFDKPSCVPLAKVPEQCKRDAAARASAAKRARQRGLGCDDADDGNERRDTAQWWGRALSNRETRPTVLAEVLTQVREEVALSLNTWRVPEGTRVIVDAEPGPPWSIPGGASCHELWNRVGEFDNALGFWASALQQPGRVLLDTIDTDLLFVVALYEVLHPAPVSVTVRFAARGRAAKGEERRHTFVSARRLVRAIAERTCVPGHDARTRVETLIRCAVLGGSDFTSGIRGVSHASLLRALVSPQLKRGAGTSLLRETIECAVRARFPRSYTAHLPASAHVNGELARTEWVLSYWCAHIMGDASPRYPCPSTGGWGARNASFPWLLNATNITVCENVGKSGAEDVVIGYAEAAASFAQLDRALYKLYGMPRIVRALILRDFGELCPLL